MPSLKVNWNRIQIPGDVNPVLNRFERWLLENGYRETSIDAYSNAIRKFLDDVKTTNPSLEDAKMWHSNLVEARRARSTINIWGAALKAFYKSRGAELILPCLKVDNKIPYFFSESDVKAILDSCSNFKHLVMLTLMFHCMLRASDLANLQDEDIDLGEYCLRIRNGKGGKPAILPIPPQCANLLDQYLQIRPRIQINGKYYLFYTDQLNKWNRTTLEHMFLKYKIKAGIKKPGCVHVWGRHSPASIMVQRGCDVYSLQQLMRHSDIKTTVRYLHTDVATLRDKQNKYLDI